MSREETEEEEEEEEEEEKTLTDEEIREENEKHDEQEEEGGERVDVSSSTDTRPHTKDILQTLYSNYVASGYTHKLSPRLQRKRNPHRVKDKASSCHDNFIVTNILLH